MAFVLGVQSYCFREFTTMDNATGSGAPRLSPTYSGARALASAYLNLKKLDEELRAVGFDGSAIIEYEGDAKSPMLALKKCAEAIRKELSVA